LDFGSPVSLAADPPKQAAVTPSDTGGKKKDKSEKAEKSSKKEKAWLTFYSGRSVDILYCTGESTHSGAKKVSFRLVNRGPLGMSISADATFKSFAPYQSLIGNVVRLAHHAPYGSEAESSIDLGCGESLVSKNHQVDGVPQMRASYHL
jgi:hypothetical protein